MATDRHGIIMHFSRLELSHFGPIDRFTADLEPHGMHVVTGPNGAGKTHILAALLHSVLGASARLITRGPAPAIATEIRVVLSSGGRKEEAKTYASSTDSPHLSLDPVYATIGSNATPRLFANVRGLLGNPELPRLVLDPDVAGGADYAGGIPLGALEDLPLVGRAADAWRRIRNYIAHVPEKRWSVGEHTLLDYAIEYDRRRGCSVSLPLVVDTPFGRLDSDARELAFSMLSAIAEQDQVIVLDNGPSSTWASRNHAGMWTLNGGCSGRSALGVAPFAYENLSRIAATGIELGYVERLAGRMERGSEQRAELQRRARAQDSLLDEVLEFRAEFQVSQQKLLEVAVSSYALTVDTNNRVKDLQGAVALLLARTEELMESLAGQLEAATEAFDREKIEATCDDIARRVASQVRKDLGSRASIAEVFQTLRAEFATDWDRLNPISQKDVALSRMLQQEAELHAQHLAILQICRAIEGEIMINIFVPFRESIRGGTVTYPETDARLSKQASRSYKTLHDYAVTDKGKLTLGQFGWVVKTAKEQRDIPLFDALVSFLTNRFLDKFDEVTKRLVGISLGSISELDPVAPDMSMSDVRNACAHPPSLAGDQASVTGDASFAAIWRFALVEPIEFVLLLTRNAGARA